MPATKRYNILGENGEIIMEDVTRKEVFERLGMCSKSPLTPYIQGGVKLQGKYTVSRLDEDLHEDKPSNPGGRGCYKFTSEMLAKWDTLNRKYGTRWNKTNDRRRKHG